MIDKLLAIPLRIPVGLLALLLIVAAATTFTLREEHAAVVTRFGKPVRVVSEPGLHGRLPWPIERALVVDARRRVLGARHVELLTRDKKNVILLGYAIWRVDDPLLFVRALGREQAAREKLEGLLVNAQIGVLGRHDLDALVSSDPQTLRLDEIEQAIREATDEVARTRFGIAVIETGLERLSLPEANTAFVFEQMRAERRQFAAQHRAEGRREGERLRAEADLEKARLLAEANEEAARIRGRAEAEAARLFAEAHAKDPELYRFLRSLESLEKTIGEDTTLVLRTDSAPFELLEER